MLHAITRSNTVLIYIAPYNKLKAYLKGFKKFSHCEPLLKKLSSTCLPSLRLCHRSHVRKYPPRFGVSATRFCNAARDFLTQETANNVLENSVYFMLKFYVPIGFFRW